MVPQPDLLRQEAAATAFLLERAATNAAVWGDQAPDLLDELDRAVITDPWCEAVVAAVVAVHRSGADTREFRHVVHVHESLVDRGVHAPSDFHQLAMVDVAEAGASIEALPLYLHLLHEAAERRTLLARLVALADTLEHPGGPERVARVLGVAA